MSRTFAALIVCVEYYQDGVCPLRQSNLKIVFHPGLVVTGVQALERTDAAGANSLVLGSPVVGADPLEPAAQKHGNGSLFSMAFDDGTEEFSSTPGHRAGSAKKSS